jgi:stage III sporulation protein SpoIIIAA
MCGVHGFYMMLRTLELQFPPDLVGLEEVIEDCSPAWGEGPLPSIGVEFAAKCAQYLLSSGKAFWNDFDEDTTSIVQDIYKNSAKESLEFGEYRLFAFDKDHEYCLVDKSLLSATRPDDMFPEETYSIASDIESLLNILPEKLQEMMVKLKIDMDSLSDIVLDLGRKPQCWVAGSRVLLCEPQTPGDVVTATTISEMLQKCGSFGSDHRAVLDGRLHRISALHNREDAVVGLTFRVARCIQGTVGSFIDILLGSEHSILIMGEPGSGKTTVIREISRILSEQKNVFVVDTSNEIAGGGAVPHHCIGMSRRIMVPTLDAQCTAMVECVQNHTPYVMVIDEIGRTKEVAAAESVKQRGVRMVASAHGNLRSLVRNRALRGLIGNLETVIVGDTVAAVMAAGAPSRQEEYDDESSNSGGTLRKTCIQRASEPIFDIIVEMERGMYHEVRVIRNVGRAVDEILLGRKFEVEHRRRSKDGTDPRISYSMA